MLENARKLEKEREKGQTSLFEMFAEDSGFDAMEDDSVPEPDGKE